MEQKYSGPDADEKQLFAYISKRLPRPLINFFEVLVLKPCALKNVGKNGSKKRKAMQRLCCAILRTRKLALSVLERHSFRGAGGIF
jgi:hypothetical protein